MENKSDTDPLDIDFEDLGIEELIERLDELEKTILKVETAFTVAALSGNEWSKAAALVLADACPTWANTFIIDDESFDVQIRPLVLPERLLVHLLQACGGKRLTDWLYWLLLDFSCRVFDYYDERYYDEDQGD